VTDNHRLMSWQVAERTVSHCSHAVH